MSDIDTIELDDHPKLAEFVESLAASGRPCRVTRHGKTFTEVTATARDGKPTEPVDIRGPNWTPDPTSVLPEPGPTWMSRRSRITSTLHANQGHLMVRRRSLNRHSGN